nr:Ptc1 protein [Danio rerio]
MASDPRDPGPAGGVFGDLPPSYTRSPPPVNSDLLRRPSYCHAAFALKQISKVTNAFPPWNTHTQRDRLSHTHARLVFLRSKCDNIFVFQGASELFRTFFSLVLDCDFF